MFNKKKLEIIHKFEELLDQDKQAGGSLLKVEFVTDEDDQQKKGDVYIKNIVMINGENTRRCVVLRIKRDAPAQEIYDNIQTAKHLLNRVADEYKAEREHNLQHPNLFTQMSYIWKYRKEILK